ncbi:hypothetical protein [Colwellia psychrerythraea]|uniref:Uncharacterized protein n=1 Tax=Colwellia psychrerythraea (strain 34H / ATCC BAA-681) TaxID=167879 RepID=Q485B2_COLP3|nr:hypothetical protein [Colwellia psychrerythraea]AAZ28799.1 hypothetical protein CPS_1615 [Colwellia psychrerythraea 34H]
MNIKSIALNVLLLTFGLTLNVNAQNNGGGKHFVLNLIGTGHQYQSTVPDIDGDGVDDDAICFDVALVNIKNQQIIGSATDCLASITPGDTGLALVGTSYFNLPSGTLITRGNTTVSPVLHDTITPKGQKMTHITGASGEGNAIIGGTGRFEYATGTARLSGMVDMTNFSGVDGDPISFDCIFVIDLD